MIATTYTDTAERIARIADMNIERLTTIREDIAAAMANDFLLQSGNFEALIDAQAKAEVAHEVKGMIDYEEEHGRDFERLTRRITAKLLGRTRLSSSPVQTVMYAAQRDAWSEIAGVFAQSW